MSKVTVDLGKGPKEYPLPENLTFREMQAIKRITGLRAGEVFPALYAGDTDAFLAFAYIAMRRAGEAITEDQLLDLPIDRIDLDFSEDEEADAGPPAEGADGAAPEPPPDEPSPSTS